MVLTEIIVPLRNCENALQTFVTEKVVQFLECYRYSFSVFHFFGRGISFANEMRGLRSFIRGFKQVFSDFPRSVGLLFARKIERWYFNKNFIKWVPSETF